MQAFIHASAGEFNGLRLAWIGRAVFLILGPLDLCWTHLEAISQAKSKRTSTGERCGSWIHADSVRRLSTLRMDRLHGRSIIPILAPMFMRRVDNSMI